MTEFDVWAATAYKGKCCNCKTEGLVFAYQRNSASPLIHMGATMELCFICAHTVGANAMEYPDQHPYHGSIVGPILGAISLMFQEIRKPKKPRQPRQKKTQMVQLTQMTPAGRK